MLHKEGLLVEELLDEETFMGLIDNDQFHPDELEEEAGNYHNEEFSPLSLLTMNAGRQKLCGEIIQELKCLRDLVVSLAQKMETLKVSSYQKGTPLPTIVADLNPLRGPSMVHRPPGTWQTLTVSHASPLQTSVREATSRGEDVQVFQMFLVIKQRDAQGNLVGVHVPIPFKQLRE